MVLLNDSQLYVLGGLGQKSVEMFDLTSDDISWKKSPEMPQVSARACAVAVGQDKIIVIGGHNNDSSQSLAKVWEFDSKSGEWSELDPMREARRDHACLLVQFEKTDGILVTGGNDVTFFYPFQ